MKHLIKIKIIFTLIATLCIVYAKGQYNVVVAKDGTGNYTTIQDAVTDAPSTSTSPYRILIKKGIYKENLTIAKKFIQFIGEDVAKTIITYDNYNGKAMPGGGTYGTANSASVIINSDDFSSANITYENSTGDAPQALAINVSGDRASFKNCRFLGGQDTFLGYNSKYPQSLYKCYIEGVVDFIFGNSKTVFDECVIYPRDRIDNQANSYITASNTRENKGFLFRNCDIIANRGVTKYVLGRPWQNDAATAEPKSTSATIFINTKMSNVVKPEGWAVWDAGTDVSKIIYAEYNSMDMNGNLLDVSSRVAWSNQLRSVDAAEYLDNNIVFKDRNDNIWDPYAVFLDGNTVPANRLAISNFKYIKSGTELTFTWNLNWPENNVVYKLYRIADGGSPVLVNEQTINGNNVNISYAPVTGREVVPPSMSTYEYYVEATSANGTVRSESISISAVPVINLTGTLQAFKQGIDKPSSSQILTVNGEYLLGNVTVTPPVNFEVSVDNGVNWSNASSPLILSATNGLLTSKTILVRLNAAAAGTYAGNLTIVSGTGAHNKSIAVTGETYSHPLVNSKTIASLSLAQNSNATYLKDGLETATLNLNTYVLSEKVSGTNISYSTVSGIQFAPNSLGGGWGANEIKNMTDKTKYIELTLKAASAYEARVDSLLFNLAVFQTTGNFAVEYSTDNFQTSTLLQSGLLNGTPETPITYGSFTNGAFVLANQNTGNKRYAFALNGANGVQVATGKELKVRMYFRTGSSSNDRYATLKNIDFKGSVVKAAVNGDYITVKSGNWDDVSVWKKYDGTTWNTVSAYPVYNSGGTSIIDNGHVILLPTITNGSGYVNNFTVREGGKLTIPSTSTVKFATQSPNFVVEGELVNDGSISNNGIFNLTVKGTFTNNSGSLLKIDVAGSQLIIGEDGVFDNIGTIQATNSTIQVGNKGTLINKGTVTNGASGSIIVQLGATFTNKSSVGYTNVNLYGTYEHAANSSTMPATINFQDGSTFLISGITTSQTGILKNTLSYYNVTWNNTGQTNYYAFQGNLVENIRGKFTVNSTGSAYLALLNTSGTIGMGSYEQNGGRVVVRENGTVNAVMNVSGDFIVNAGTFESNSAASVKIYLKGANSKYKYTDATNTLTTLDIDVAGNYELQSALTVRNLSIAEGKLSLGTNNLTATNITRTGSGYVVTNGAGSLTYKNVGSSVSLFPIGTASSYTPLSISNTGTVSDFIVKVKTGFDNVLPSNTTKSVNLQWDITPTVNGAKANIGFQWNVTDQNSAFDIGSPIIVANYHNNAYVGYPTTISGSNPYGVSITGIEQFSPFVIINDGVLPLKLLSFTGKLKQAVAPSVLLNWQTAEEENVSHFEIERAGSELNFIKIGLKSALNSPGTNNYTYEDTRPLNGVNYYRLMMVDKDGRREEGKYIAVNNNTLAISVYPNPTERIINIAHPVIQHLGWITIYNLQGKKEVTVSIAKGQSLTQVDLSTVVKGIYFIRIETDGQKQEMKIIKK